MGKNANVSTASSMVTTPGEDHFRITRSQMYAKREKEAVTANTPI